MSLLPAASSCCDPCQNVSTTTTNLSDLIDAATASRLGMVNVVDEGADSTGTTDSTDSIQAAIDSASTTGRSVFFPPGTFKHTGLIVYTGTRLIGSGSGRQNDGANTILLYTGTGIAIQGNGAAVLSFSALHLTLQGTDGSGGTGLLMDSFEYGLLLDVLIGKHRNAGDTGIGLRLINTYGNCAHNRFIDLTIEDSDTAIILDSTNASNATGYNYFSGIVIYQEHHCVRLLRTLANGSTYNTFSGLLMQGSPGSTGDYLYIEGHGNRFTGVNIDQAGTGSILTFALAATTHNYVHFLGGFDITKYTNNQSTGANNTIDFDGYVTHAPGKPFTILDPLSQTEFSVQSTGSNPVELHFGNANGSQSWRQIMAGGVATYSFSKSGSGTMLRLGAGQVEVLGELDVSVAINLPNSQTVRWASTTAVEEAGVGLSAANNMQLFAPTEGGNVQLIPRHASGTIQLLPNSLNGLSVDANATAGNTRLQLYAVDGGALYRVKTGANGTGPGGVGRALYIDNV